MTPLKYWPLAVATLLVLGLSGSPAIGSHGAEPVVARLLPGLPLGGSAEPTEVSLDVQRYPYLIPRATSDRPDERTGSQVHLVYVVPSDAADEQLDRLGVIEDSIRSVNHWMRGQTGDLQWRLDTFSFAWDDPATAERDPVHVEAVDVTFIRSELPAVSLNDLEELRGLFTAHELNNTNKRYIAYVHSDGEGSCGEAGAAVYPFEDEGIPLVQHASGVGYSAVYLDSDPLCRAREFASGPTAPSYSEVISGHELIHNDGLVPIPAARHCPEAPLHVCTPGLGLVAYVSGLELDPEQFDLMYPKTGIPLSQKQLDIGDDDYFRHPFPFRDLENSRFLERIG